MIALAALLGISAIVALLVIEEWQRGRENESEWDAVEQVTDWVDWDWPNRDDVR